MKVRVQFFVCIIFFLYAFHHASAIENTKISPNTLKELQKTTALSSLQAILSPVEKESVQIGENNCPKPKPSDTRMSLSSRSTNMSLRNINHESGFDRDYTPADLVDISGSIKTANNEIICLSYPAATQLIIMAKDMARLGLKLVVNSGFRSYDDQEILHENYAPIAKTVKYPRVAPAGHSEHQSGLAVDVASELSPGKFATSKESAWLHEHAHLYGFLVSYPENGEDKTGFMYEPWHLRYVGIENAVLLHEANYTLAFKPEYYKTPVLGELLTKLKTKFKIQNEEEIGG